MKSPGKGKPKRNYSPQTLKILFALSSNECAEPNCCEPIIARATSASPPSVIGQIAHIFAISKDGPRGKVGLAEKDLNQPSNLLLLCPNHHTKVDSQYETYPAPLLTEWKTLHEKKYGRAVSASITEVGYAELEVAARSLLSASAAAQPSSLAIIPPREKIDKNGLGSASTMLLSMGAAKSKEVQEMLIKAAQLDPAFPDRLGAAFVKRYRDCKAKNQSGDDIFNELYDWAGGADGNKGRQAAGLCIIAHLFIICDIFEK